MMFLRQLPRVFSNVVPIVFPAALTAFLLVGCGKSEITELRERFVLADEPSGAKVVSKIRATLQKDGAPDSVSVVLSGRIYAGKDSEPWSAGKCAFILTDFAGHNGDSEHDPYECPYCSESIEDYRAFVNFGDAGQAAPVDAREVFEVKERQKVTVTGTATLDDAGEVMIEGKGLYIVR